MFEEKFIEELAQRIAPAVAAQVEERLGNGNSVKPRYLSVDQAAVYMSTTVDGVRGMLRAKRFPCKKLGDSKNARIVIDVHDIDKAMAEGTYWL